MRNPKRLVFSAVVGFGTAYDIKFTNANLLQLETCVWFLVIGIVYSIVFYIAVNAFLSIGPSSDNTENDLGEADNEKGEEK